MPALPQPRPIEVIEVRAAKDKGLLDDSRATGSYIPVLYVSCAALAYLINMSLQLVRCWWRDWTLAADQKLS
jgi:hypothetical protein